MAEHVCPWWLGPLMASPFRRWWMQNPEDLLAPYIKVGMTVLEPGPGMGFFTLSLARLTGPAGRVIAVEVQPKMLAGLRRRARRAGLLPRIDLRLVQQDSMRLDDLKGAVDFVLAYAVVHEMPSTQGFFHETVAALKRGGLLLLVEPVGHVNLEAFKKEVEAAQRAGFEVVIRPAVRNSLAALLRKI